MKFKILLSLLCVLLFELAESRRASNLPESLISSVDDFFEGSFSLINPLMAKKARTSIYEQSAPLTYKIHQQTTAVLSAYKKLKKSNMTEAEKLSVLSGYVIKDAFCPKYTPRYFRCFFGNPYRTIDGSCNNVQYPWQGKAGTPYSRILSPAYDDGINLPRTLSVSGEPLPNPREIAMSVHSEHVNAPQTRTSLILAYFGLHVYHDILHTARSSYRDGEEIHCGCSMTGDCFSIPINATADYYNSDQFCLPFTRSSAALPKVNCHFSHREQLNEQTAFLDLSNVYGTTEEMARSLRTGENGLLRTSSPMRDNEPPGLPIHNGMNRDSCAFIHRTCTVNGDVRTEDNQMLYLFTETFVNEHNRIASRISEILYNVDDEFLYNEARKLNIAKYQHIVYNEYLPMLVGEKAALNWKLLPGEFGGYNPHINPQVKNAFTITSRFGHTMINKYHLSIDSNLNLVDKYTTDDVVHSVPEYSSETMRGLLFQNSYYFSPHVNEYLNNFLFAGLTKDFKRTSLSSLNIQRGRDHGLPGYNAYREWCGLGRAKTFREFTNFPEEHLTKISSLYSSPDDVDLFTGLMSEYPVRDGVVGPTTACILSSGFYNLKFGDRYFYENHVYTDGELDNIRNANLARIICENNNMEEIQPNPFMLPSTTNSLISCGLLPQVDIELFDFTDH